VIGAPDPRIVMRSGLTFEPYSLIAVLSGL
jgi:hypothetical protein